jgi:AcrR family transcriptional regulator
MEIGQHGANALKTFYRVGFNAIGMDRIAEETGVSKTSIYNHFRTKDDLILATLRLRDEQFRNRLARRVEALAKDPRERLGAIFDALGEWFDEPGYQGVHVREGVVRVPGSQPRNPCSFRRA